MLKFFKESTTVLLFAFTCWLGAGSAPAPAQTVAQWQEAIEEIEGVLDQCYEAKADASLDMIAALDALGLVTLDQQANILKTLNKLTDCIHDLERVLAMARGAIDDLQGNPLASFMTEIQEPARACPPPIPPRQAQQMKLERLDRILAGDNDYYDVAAARHLLAADLRELLGW